MKYLIIHRAGQNGPSTIATVDTGVEPMPNVGDSIAIGEEMFEVMDRHWVLVEASPSRFSVHHQHSANVYVRKC